MTQTLAVRHKRHMGRVPPILIERIVRRGYELEMSDREVSIAATGKPDAIRNIKNDSMPSADRLDAIARVLRVSPGWLLGKDEDPAKARQLEAANHLDSVLVPYYDVDFSMGDGAFTDDETVFSQLIPVAKAWLRGKVAGALGDVMFLPGRGDSMEPTIRTGDWLLVDKSQRDVREPDLIWAFNHAETGFIKRVRRLPGARYLIQSDNQSVRDWETAAADVHLVGRVVSIMRWT